MDQIGPNVPVQVFFDDPASAKKMLTYLTDMRYAEYSVFERQYGNDGNAAD